MHCGKKCTIYGGCASRTIIFIPRNKSHIGINYTVRTWEDDSTTSSLEINMMEIIAALRDSKRGYCRKMQI
jgi:hypothetical protein